MFSDIRLCGAHLITLIMIEVCVFMLIIGKIIEENQILQKHFMNLKAARVGILTPLSQSMNLVVQINNFAINAMDGKS